MYLKCLFDLLFNFLFLNILYWLWYYSVLVFLPFIPLCPAPPHPPSFPDLVQFKSVGCTYEFFGFSISCTILNLPLQNSLDLPSMLIIPRTFSPILRLPLPTDNPPFDLYLCDVFPVLFVCFLCFWFGFFFFFLGSVVDSCEFVVILIFIFLIFFFLLGKSL